MSVPPPSTETTEARIVAVASQHFRQDGFARTTIVRIAQDAGMTHANVYRYFPSKAALAERIVGTWLRDIEQRLNDVTQAPDPANDKLERFLTLIARAYEDKARGDAAIFALFAAAAERQDAYVGRHRARVRELLRRVLDEGLSIRVFSGGDVRRLERLVLDVMFRFLDPHAVQAGLAERRGQGAGFDAPRERVTRLLLRGLAGRHD